MLSGRSAEEGVEMASMKGDTYREYMLKYYTLLGKQAAERAAREEKSSDSSAPPGDIREHLFSSPIFIREWHARKRSSVLYLLRSCDTRMR